MAIPMTDSNQVLDQILRLSEDQRSGTLILRSGKHTIQLLFKDGNISAAESDLPYYQIGRFLSRKGFIVGSDIVGLLRKSQKKKLLLGETAVQRNLLNDSELADIIKNQIVELVMHALTLDFTIKEFKDSIKPLYLPAQISSWQLIVEMARKNVPASTLDPNQLFVLSNGHSFTDVSWYPQELSVISGLQKPRTTQELAAFTGLDYPSVCKILSVFYNLQLIQTVDATASDTPVSTTSEFKESFESMVPEIRKESLSNKLDLYHQPSSFISEQFKTLKVRLHELSLKKQVKVITVSSSSANEGKSLICTNLGLCFAKDPNRRVILLDCDLRKPTIHQHLGISIEPGLYGYLSEGNLQSYFYMRRLGRLFFMTAGEITNDPIELLSQDKLAELIKSLKRDFDMVIIDTPPIGLVSDGKIMTKLSDGLILVVRSNQTTYNDLERSCKMLDQDKLIGVVLNDVQAHMFSTQYDYRYYNYKYRNIYPYGHKKTKNHSRAYFK